MMEMPVFIRRSNFKLREHEIKDVIKRVKSGEKQFSVALDYNVSQSTVHRIWSFYEKNRKEKYGNE